MFVLCLLTTAIKVAGGAAAIAVTAPACTGGHVDFPDAPPALPAPHDSVTVTVSAEYPIATLDIFIYRDSLTKPLESHLRTTSATATLPSAKGDRIMLAIANSPGEFNLQTLKRFDSAEQLTMYYRDEDPSFPLMTAVVSSGEDSVQLRAVPLLCPVVIVSVDNATANTLEKPVLNLRKVNAHTEMLRTDGFRPGELVEDADEVAHPEMMRAALGRDIGLYPFCPGVTLYCYPCDGEESLGSPHPELEISCLSGGERRTFTHRLPAVRRGETAMVSLVLAE